MKQKLELVGGLDLEEDAIPIPKPSWSQDDPYWLNNVPLGTVFFVKKRNTRDFNLGVFALKNRVGKANATNLVLLPQGQEIWVDPREFSTAYSMFDVFLTPEDIDTMGKEGLFEDKEENKDNEQRE